MAKKIALVTIHGMGTQEDNYYEDLEDRIVKHTLKQVENITVLTKKPITASENEISLNPRARSAKLRAGEKL